MYQNRKHNSNAALLGVSAEEKRRRRAVLTREAGTILIKITTPTDLGLAEKPRDERRIRSNQRAEAEKLGVNFIAYRPRGDTGFPVIEKRYRVRLDDFFSQLDQNGYRFVGGHKFLKEGRNHFTNVLEFRLVGNVGVFEENIPPAVREILNNGVFNDVCVWANQKDDGRLDTINCIDGQQSWDEKRGCYLTFSLNDTEKTYKLY